MTTETFISSAPTADTARAGRRRPAGLALVVAPLLLVAGNLLSIQGDATDPAHMAKLAGATGGEQASILLFVTAFALLIIGVSGMVGAVGARGGRLATTGAWLFVIGAAGFLGLVSTGVYDIGVARSVPAAQAATIADTAGGSGAATALVALGVLVMPVGLILAAFGVWRAGIAPVWVPIVTFVAFAVLTVGEGMLGGILGDLLLLAGVGYVGVRMLRGVGAAR